LYFHTNPKELTPKSIAKFLEEQEGVKDDFARPHKLCGNEFNFIRKGRDETLHKIFDCIVMRYIRNKRALKEGKGVGEKNLHPFSRFKPHQEEENLSFLMSWPP